MMLKDKLMDFRKEAGFTQQEIAELIGVERSTYACYETGKTQIPFRKLQLLAIVYHVKLEDFNPVNALVLHDDTGYIPKQKEDRVTLEKDERILLARIRLINAMGKQDELEESLNHIAEEE